MRDKIRAFFGVAPLKGLKDPSVYKSGPANQLKVSPDDSWLVAFERSLRADFIPHIVISFLSKNSQAIRVFVQGYAPFIIL